MLSGAREGGAEGALVLIWLDREAVVLRGVDRGAVVPSGVDRGAKCA